MGAIPTQRMESPAAAPKPAWRPDPGYRPSTAGDPAAPKPQGFGAKKPTTGTGEPAWETAGTRYKRIADESAYNKNRAANPNSRFVPKGTPGQFKLKPGQVPTAKPTGADLQKGYAAKENKRIENSINGTNERRFVGTKV